MKPRLLLATGFGVGYAPVAPGTVGSLVGLALLCTLTAASGAWAAAAGTLVAVAAGFWSAGAGEAHFARVDPGPVVIDEVAGQMLALVFLPLTLWTALGGFLVFRLLDIWKPFPAKWLESLPGGAGIMADDLVVAAYTNLLLHAVAWIV